MHGTLRLFGWALLVVSAVVLFAGGGAWWLYQQATAPGPLAQARTLVIPPHTGLTEIAGLLARAGVIRHRLPFEISARLSGYGASLQAGEYRFPAGTSPLAAAGLIASGKTVKYRLTVPEGLTSRQIIALVNAAPSLTGSAGKPPAEGTLLPDTYIYSYGETRQQMVERMQRAMIYALASVWADRRPGLPLADPQQLLILASMVERETGRADERARVAAVFVNRLRLGMRLQSDPTVLYALGDGGAKKLGHPLTRADLAVASPYNTYFEKGLPPGPIDNPGVAALRAAAEPAPTDDLYFVADGSGGHVFAHTLAEHDRNVAQYRRGLAAAPPMPSLKR